MADFPDAVPTFRTIANKPNQAYNPDLQTTIFKEDIQQLRDEITAIDTAFMGSGHVFDDDVTVTEFFGSPVDLGTGGFCRVDAVKQWQFIWLRINIVFGADLDIGSLPLSIAGSDLPIELPVFPAQIAFPGNFGALNKADNALQMFAPAYNNVPPVGPVILFFKEYGAAFTDYLMGSGSTPAPEAGDQYWGTIMVPDIEFEE